MLFILSSKVLQLLVFAPLAGASRLRDFLPFVTELVVGVASLVFLFMKQYKLGIALAWLFALGSSIFWWFVTSRNGKPIWSDVFWLAIPPFVFAAAALLYRFAQPAIRINVKKGPMEVLNG